MKIPGRRAKTAGRSFKPKLEQLEVRQLLDGVPSLPTIPPLVKFGSLSAFDNYFLNQALESYQSYFGVHALPVPGTGIEDPSVPRVNVPLPPNNSGPGVNGGDIVQTDAGNLYVLANNQLVVLATHPDGTLRVSSRTELPANPILEFLEGTRLTIVSTSSHPIALPIGRPTGNIPSFSIPLATQPQIEISTYDVSDPARPIQVQDAIFDGLFGGADAIDRRLYVVSSNHLNDLPIPQSVPDGNGGRTYESQASYIARITPDIPDYVLPHVYASTIVSPTVSGLLSPPADTYQPRSTSDTELNSILTFDMAASGPGLLDVQSYVASQPPTFYATAEHIYLVTAESLVQRFDIQGDHLAPGPAGYVPGQVLNSFALEESGTELRIAVTLSFGSDATNAVYILQPDGDHLSVIGSLGGFAPGSRISAIRYLQDLAYIATVGDTFQAELSATHPLYVIDLSDATAPSILGQGALPGIVENLEPLDSSNLLAIGLASIQPRNLQLELVSIADSASPTVIDQQVIPSVGNETSTGTTSEADLDPRAIAYDTDQQILTLPVTATSSTGGAENAASALYVFHVDFGAGLQLEGSIIHDSVVRRGILEGDFLYSIADRSAQVHSLGQLIGDGQGVSLIDDPRDVQTGSVNVQPNHVFAGTLLSYAITDPTQVDALVQWGDDTTSLVTPVLNGGDRYSVSGTHTYTEAGSYQIVVTVRRNGQDVANFYLQGLVGSLDQPNEDFLEQLYSKVLNRTIEAQAMNFWAAGLANGLTREIIALSLLNSSEYRADQVESFYQEYLHRSAEVMGVDAWVAFLESGHSLPDVRSAILGSPEYFAIHGGTATGFIQAVFQDVLNRPLDPGSALIWDTAVNIGVPRLKLITTLQNSHEGSGVAVDAAFQAFLQRNSDSGGRAYFSDALLTGRSLEEIDAAILGSQEFLQGSPFATNA